MSVTAGVTGPAGRLVVALDVDSLAAAVDLASALAGRVGWFKVGLELYTRHGPDAVAAIAAHGPVFLDLKLHDIPTTVARSVTAAAATGAGLLTVHATGGRAMLAAAAEAARSAADRPRLLAVTVLTSTSDPELAELGVAPAATQVPRLAALAVASGITGLVCAPQDLTLVRRAVGTAPLIVTPGIRAAAASADDHTRALGPAEAVAAGADLLVVGRPITRAQDPVAAADDLAGLLLAAGDRGLSG